MEKRLQKNVLILIALLLFFYLFALLETCFFSSMKMYYALEYLFSALARFVVTVAIPLVIAIIAKLAFKKSFPGVFWRSIILISVPLTFFGIYGGYKENPEKIDAIFKQTSSPVKTVYSLDQVNEAIRASPTNAINYYNRGVIYTTQLKHEAAIDDYSKAIELDPNFSGSYLNRCTEYISLNEFVKALFDCSNAIKLNPNLSEAFFNRAKIHAHIGRRENSVDDMKQAARLGNLEAIKILRKNNIDWNQ